MKIRVVIETNKVRGDESKMKPEALEDNTLWEVKSIKLRKGSLVKFF